MATKKTPTHMQKAEAHGKLASKENLVFFFDSDALFLEKIEREVIVEWQSKTNQETLC